MGLFDKFKDVNFLNCDKFGGRDDIFLLDKFNFIYNIKNDFYHLLEIYFLCLLYL